MVSKDQVDPNYCHLDTVNDVFYIPPPSPVLSLKSGVFQAHSTPQFGPAAGQVLSHHVALLPTTVQISTPKSEPGLRPPHTTDWWAPAAPTPCGDRQGDHALWLVEPISTLAR